MNMKQELAARPLIGICGIPMQCQFGGVWDQPVTMLHRSYSAAIARGDGVALVLTPDTLGAEPPARLIEILDGVLLVGGGDIDPTLYGAVRAPETSRIDPLRDSVEIGLAQAAMAAGVPLLGICRGMEIINVALGGTLTQHLPATVGHDGHLRNAGTFERHRVDLAADSTVAELAGSASRVVMSHHHQGVDVLGSGVLATGWSTADHIVEAIEVSGEALTLGVQWHPEEDPNSTVIPNFVKAVQQERSLA